MNFYNDIDPKACAWIRELIAHGEIPPGEVSERSITEIDPDELGRFTQCHFFAGIAGWSYALRLTDWPTERPVWTASLPCQPFSAAGQQEGGGDARNLWTPFFALVQRCGPQRLFGEQVEAAIGFGWLDRVFADLGAEGYACGAAVLGAHSVGAPHRRQRLYWMANASSERISSEGRGEDDGAAQRARGEERKQRIRPDAGSNCDHGSMAIANGRHPSTEREQRSGQHGQQPEDCGACGMEHPKGDGWEQRGTEPSGRRIAGGCSTERMGDSISGGQSEHQERNGEEEQNSTDGNPCRPNADRPSERMGNAQSDDERREWESRQGNRRPEPVGRSGAWSNFEIIPCRDGKARRIESGTFPLVAGLPRGVVPSGPVSVQEAQASGEARVARLRGYGNAIVPQLAAQLILASEEALNAL